MLKQVTDYEYGNQQLLTIFVPTLKRKKINTGKVTKKICSLTFYQPFMV